MTEDKSVKCETCDGHGDYYVEIEFLEEPILVECEDCKTNMKEMTAK